MDYKSITIGDQLLPYEMYLYPPVTNDISMGDILLIKGNDKDDPSSYVIVLTPSCDLSTEGGRKPKVDSVLVALCCEITEFIKASGLSYQKKNRTNKDTKSLRNGLSTNLTRDQSDGYSALPAFASILPMMSVSFKHMFTIPQKLIEKYNELPKKNKKYKQILSVDSPFREKLAWAFVQITGRPGVPTTNLNPWIDDIITHLTPEPDGGEGDN